MATQNPADSPNKNQTYKYASQDPNHEKFINPTIKLAIFREGCKAEKRHYDQWQLQDQIKTGGYLGGKYKINDPTKRQYMPDKITQMTPTQPYKKAPVNDRDNKNEDAIQRKFQLNAVERRIKTANQRPQQKYKRAATSNMEYGWLGGDGNPQKKAEYSHKPLRNTPITGYVENYYLTKGINPFKIKGFIPKPEDAKNPGK